MTTFTTTLFKAVDAADSLFINQVEVEQWGYCDLDDAGNPVVRFIAADDEDYFFADQPITVCDGQASAQLAQVIETQGVDQGRAAMTLLFQITRTMVEADLGIVDPRIPEEGDAC